MSDLTSINQNAPLGLPLRGQAPAISHPIPTEYKDVARGMEAEFVNYMLTQMRKTIPQEDPDSSSMEYYNSLMDSERAKIMTTQGEGIGIQKVILDQIYPQSPKGHANNGNRGPLELSGRKQGKHA